MNPDDYPRRHPRELIVEKAVRDLKEQLCNVIREAELTEGEQLRVCTEVYSNWVGGMAKYIIRDERHGNTSKPGGLTSEPKEFDVEGFCKDSDPPPKE